ncbi:hypothetical protein OHW01_12280 [Acinetobacter baumannii]|uniref:hypothetical protein n=1 Tax=Acinetobacter baumannii TaxID=470 RepID=UPI000447D539|nr:hypothetical protein [Acinetobacter baumannii]EIB6895028.1 hypothetical protein [Acinetobacter baumannii]EKV0481959.1 hypothetical protein [Acinetobacter baumannii]EKW6896173.1 hypothetical protein [Acinetobacter baumannii]ELB2462708.1 hypothetical protein [Acinetobacter baumannii]EXE74741.1 hypothetical protein J587_0458 [Acinetobacter baumannii 144107]
MSLDFLHSHYEDHEPCVSWQGIGLLDGESCVDFFLNEVKQRVEDTEGKEEFADHLRGLALTGMAKESLEAFLTAGEVEPLDWAVGEALAEAYLIKQHNIIFPWNMEREKRNIHASTAGADIVGFVEKDGSFSLVFGEVKTSSELKFPPQVITGRSGLYHQLDELAHDLTKIRQLLLWLLPRIKTSGIFVEAYNKACEAFFSSQFKAITLFGILIRDTSPNPNDLASRGQKLRSTLTPPTQCHLIALHLPFTIEDLVKRVNSGGVA